MNGKWFPVELVEPFLQDTITDAMPHVEKDLIARYLLSDMRAMLARFQELNLCVSCKLSYRPLRILPVAVL